MAEPSEMRERLRRAAAYPYAVPERSFVQAGARALPLPPAGFDLAGRQPLLAYGSNAAPEALARKLAAEPDGSLPLIRAELDDFDAVYSAHLSPYGAVPATLRHSPGTTVTVFVAYPTESQRRLLSASEPNYVERRLEGISCRLETGEAPAALDCFLSRHDALLLDGSEIALSAILARDRIFPAMGQAEALEYVRATFFPDRSVERMVDEAVTGGGRSLDFR